MSKVRRSSHTSIFYTNIFSGDTLVPALEGKVAERGRRGGCCVMACGDGSPWLSVR